MALTDPKGQFGIHSLCMYNRTTGVPLAYLKVIGESSVDFSAEFTDLEGGSQMYPWDTEVSKIGSEVTLTARQYDPDTMDILLGGELTENTAEATGTTEGLANVKGSSVYDSDTELDSIDVTSGDSGDLKEGKYLIKATAAQAATIYCFSDVDFKHGTDTTYTDDSLAIGTIDVSSGDAVLADYGLTFDTGSGTVAFTVNDTAEFYVRKPNTSSVELLFGQSGAEFSEVGIILAGQKQSDGTITYLELYKCKAAGFPMSFQEKTWAEYSVTIKALYDSAKDAIGMWRRTIAA